jgi:hypothetical protein
MTFQISTGYQLSDIENVLNLVLVKQEMLSVS